MKVTFGNAALAALCNSGTRLTQRFGPDLGGAVGERLLDIAASTADSLGQIPGAQLTVDGSGETKFVFSDRVIVRGIVSPRRGDTREPPPDEDQIVITAVIVEERTGV